MFTQLKLDPARIATWHEGAVAQLAANLPSADFPGHAAMVVATRLRNYPESYLEFGPYWWAVKAALRALGLEFGAADDPVVLAAYGGDLGPAQAIVAGELFKDHYRSTYLVGAAQFWLDDGGEESYVLFDADMEARRLGRGAQAVSANLNATSEPA